MQQARHRPAFAHDFFDLGSHFRVIGAEQRRPAGLQEVDVAVAVDVGQMRAFSLGDGERKRIVEGKIVLHAGKTKNDKARSAPMTAAVFDLLAALTLGKLPDDYVFTRLSKSGKVRPIAGFRKAWAKATAAAGCPNRLFHDLRRTGVRNLVRAGVGENTAMKITGHRTRSIFDRYDIVNEADKDRAIEMLEKDKSDRDKRQQYEQAELLLDAPRKPS